MRSKTFGRRSHLVWSGSSSTWEIRNTPSCSSLEGQFLHGRRDNASEFRGYRNDGTVSHLSRQVTPTIAFLMQPELELQTLVMAKSGLWSVSNTMFLPYRDLWNLFTPKKNVQSFLFYLSIFPLAQSQGPWYRLWMPLHNIMTNSIWCLLAKASAKEAVMSKGWPKTFWCIPDCFYFVLYWMKTMLIYSVLHMFWIFEKRTLCKFPPQSVLL